MGFLKGFKRDFAQAVNELLPESEPKNKKKTKIDPDEAESSSVINADDAPVAENLYSESEETVVSAEEGTEVSEPENIESIESSEQQVEAEQPLTQAVSEAILKEEADRLKEQLARSIDIEARRASEEIDSEIDNMPDVGDEEIPYDEDEEIEENEIRSDFYDKTDVLTYVGSDRANMYHARHAINHPMYDEELLDTDEDIDHITSFAENSKIDEEEIDNTELSDVVNDEMVDVATEEELAAAEAERAATERIPTEVLTSEVSTSIELQPENDTAFDEGADLRDETADLRDEAGLGEEVSLESELNPEPQAEAADDQNIEAVEKPAVEDTAQPETEKPVADKKPETKTVKKVRTTKGVKKVKKKTGAVNSRITEVKKVPELETEISKNEAYAGLSEDTTYITAKTRIVGDIVTEDDMDIMGRVDGNVTCSGKLILGGRINGNIKVKELYAHHAHIAGEINAENSVKIGAGTISVGNITAVSAIIAGAVKGDIDVREQVIVDSSAVVVGNITSKSIQVNSGAIVDGMCQQLYSDVDVDKYFDDDKEAVQPDQDASKDEAKAENKNDTEEVLTEMSVDSDKEYEIENLDSI